MADARLFPLAGEGIMRSRTDKGQCRFLDLGRELYRRFTFHSYRSTCTIPHPPRFAGPLFPQAGEGNVRILKIAARRPIDTAIICDA